MTDKIYMSDLTWRTEEQQKWILRFVPSRTFYCHDERDEMLRPSQRNNEFTIHTASFGVLSDDEKDLRKFASLCKKRKANISSAENPKALWLHLSSVQNLINMWKESRKLGAGRIGAQISADRKRAKSAEGVAKIKDRWPLPSSEWSTAALLEEAGVSLNTAKAHLGKRPIAQYNYQAAQKRKERRNAKR